MSKIVVFLSLVISFISCSPPNELHSDDFGFSRKYVNDKQVVEYRGDLYSGKVVEEYPNGLGTYSEGIYLNGFRSGKFIEGEYDRHGKKQLRKEVNYLNAVKHGVQIKYDNKGKVVTKGEFKNGLKEGLWLEGTARGEYKNGQKNGLWIEEGRRGEYTNGEKEGDWFQLGNNGEVLYKHGSYKSGRENGVFKTYKFQNNQYVLNSHKEYKQGKIDGLDLSLKWSLIKKGQKEQKIYNLKYTYSHNGAIGSFAKVERTRKDWVNFVTEEGNFYCKHKLQYNGKLYLITYTTKEFDKYSWEQYKIGRASCRERV